MPSLGGPKERSLTKLVCMFGRIAARSQPLTEASQEQISLLKRLVSSDHSSQLRRCRSGCVVSRPGGRNLSYEYAKSCGSWVSDTHREMRVCLEGRTSCSPTTTSPSSSTVAFGTVARAASSNRSAIASGGDRRLPTIADATGEKQISYAGSAIRSSR